MGRVVRREPGLWMRGRCPRSIASASRPRQSLRPRARTLGTLIVRSGLDASWRPTSIRGAVRRAAKPPWRRPLWRQERDRTTASMPNFTAPDRHGYRPRPGTGRARVSELMPPCGVELLDDEISASGNRPDMARAEVRARMTPRRKRGRRGKPPSAGTTSTQSNGSRKFERSEQRQQIE